MHIFNSFDLKFTHLLEDVLPRCLGLSGREQQQQHKLNIFCLLTRVGIFQNGEAMIRAQVVMSWRRLLP